MQLRDAHEFLRMSEVTLRKWEVLIWSREVPAVQLVLESGVLLPLVFGSL